MSIFTDIRDAESEDVEMLYDQAGCGNQKRGLGTYQKIVLILASVTFICNRQFFIGVAYFTKIPEALDGFECNIGDNTWVNCDKEETCRHDQILSRVKRVGTERG